MSATTNAILVLGCHGQVAQELAKVGREQRRPLVLAGRDTLDLITAHDPLALLDRYRPRAVINAAAFSAVHHAEQTPQPTIRLNAQVPA